MTKQNIRFVIALTWLIFFAAFIASPFAWIWLGFGIALKFFFTGIIGMVLHTFIVYWKNRWVSYFSDQELKRRPFKDSVNELKSE